MESRELSASEIKKLMQPKKTAPKARKPKGQDFNNRTYDGWFELTQTFQNCQVPDHDTKLDKRPSGAEGELGRFCVNIGGKFVCRYCFLELKDLIAWGEDYWL
jgi:hypothetical protein